MKLLKNIRSLRGISILTVLVMIFSTVPNVFASLTNLDNAEDITLNDVEIQENQENDAAYQEEYDLMIEEELNLADDNRAVVIDQMLLKSQMWLKETYAGNSSFGEVPTDGTSRRSTVNACIRALQIELGITATANNFGSGTISKFKAQYPNGISQQEYPSDVESNVYGIIQCALWTKGYSTSSSTITKHFYDGTGNAIKDLKTDMGFLNPDSTVTLEIMKALLSMNYFEVVSGGSEKIRQIQQELNRTYPEYLGIIPCDGVYGRQMNKALIITLQAIEGYSPEDATGNFGAGTKANLPSMSLDNSSWINKLEEYRKCVKLIQYALCCNGYGDQIDLSNNTWNTDLIEVLNQFQVDMNITQTNSMNTDTWMALLLSKGNPDRDCNACDTNRPVILDEQFEYLRNKGISIIGRYLSKSKKGITIGEIEKIKENGFSTFPIFQEIGIDEDITAFTSNRGNQDAISATAYAKNVGFKPGTIIYFAVDFDPTIDEILQYVVPYFESIKSVIGNNYQVGVYGTRNVCTQLLNRNYVTACFVSDMSTGYSGNMGFKMPSNWNLDQFAEIRTNIFLSEYNEYWRIDKVSYKGSYPVSSEYVAPINDEAIYTVTEGGFLLENGYEVNVGAARRYSGRRLKVSITLTGENGQPINDGTKVSISLHQSEEGTDPYATPLPIALLDAVPDGTTYTISDFSSMTEDYIIFDELHHYYLRYALQSGYTSSVRVKVRVESMPY